MSRILQKARIIRKVRALPRLQKNWAGIIQGFDLSFAGKDGMSVLALSYGFASHVLANRKTAASSKIIQPRSGETFRLIPTYNPCIF